VAEVVVVGGGVIGCAVSFFLARAGADVTLLERGELAGEASGAAAGMLAALSDEGGDRGPAFQKLCLDSQALYEKILPELESTGIDLRYRRSGVLHVALDRAEAEHLRGRFERQQDLSPDLLWVQGEDLRREEPEINPAAVGGYVSPAEHYLDPQRLVLALAEGARRAGALIQTEQPVQGFMRRNGRVNFIRTPGRLVTADQVVLAGGPWTARLARRLGSYVPVRPVRGQMLALAGPATPLRRVIWGQDAYLVPRENSLTFVGASVETVGYRKRNTVAVVRRLRSGANALVPGLAFARQRSAWAGLRPGTPDGLPVLGRLPGWENVWVATGHFRNGILLAPVSGQIMADAILSGQMAHGLEAFSPSRFAD
jgi:glycine oxidase